MLQFGKLAVCELHRGAVTAMPPGLQAAITAAAHAMQAHCRVRKVAPVGPAPSSQKGTRELVTLSRQHTH